MVFPNQPKSFRKWLSRGVLLVLLAIILRFLRTDEESVFVSLELLAFLAGVCCLKVFVYQLLSEHPVSSGYRTKELFRKQNAHFFQRRIAIRDLPMLFFNPYRFGRWTEARMFGGVSGALLLLVVTSDVEKVRIAFEGVFSGLPAVSGLLASLYRQDDEEYLADEWHLIGFLLTVVSLVLILLVGHSGLPRMI